MNKKFEFFLNAVHYCIYLGEIWSMKKVDNCVLRIMYYLSVLFSFENFYNKKVDERTKCKDLWYYMYGKEGGEMSEMPGIALRVLAITSLTLNPGN